VETSIPSTVDPRTWRLNRLYRSLPLCPTFLDTNLSFSQIIRNTRPPPGTTSSIHLKPVSSSRTWTKHARDQLIRAIPLCRIESSIMARPRAPTSKIGSGDASRGNEIVVAGDSVYARGNPDAVWRYVREACGALGIQWNSFTPTCYSPKRTKD
jgi:hypothetical protein